MKKKKNKNSYEKIRKPVPKHDRPLTSKKGKKGYNRKNKNEDEDN